MHIVLLAILSLSLSLLVKEDVRVWPARLIYMYTVHVHVYTCAEGYHPRLSSKSVLQHKDFVNVLTIYIFVYKVLTFLPFSIMSLVHVH